MSVAYSIPHGFDDVRCAVLTHLAAVSNPYSNDRSQFQREQSAP